MEIAQASGRACPIAGDVNGSEWERERGRERDCWQPVGREIRCCYEKRKRTGV